MEILAGAVKGALADAGLALADVDAIFCTSMQHNMGSLTLAEYLGVRPKFPDPTVIGGSAHLSPALSAASAPPAPDWTARGCSPRTTHLASSPASAT